jgi:hypothetical protein
VVVRISVEVQGKWHDVLMDFRLRERRVAELEELEMEEVDFRAPLYMLPAGIATLGRWTSLMLFTNRLGFGSIFNDH